MTDKFDPEATPECDELELQLYIIPEHYEFAQELERRARVAEHKIDVALVALMMNPLDHSQLRSDLLLILKGEQ